MHTHKPDSPISGLSIERASSLIYENTLDWITKGSDHSSNKSHKPLCMHTYVADKYP